MRTLGVTSVYCVGLVPLLVVLVANLHWMATVLLIPMLAWSCWYGFVARRWTALIAPFVLAGPVIWMAVAVGANATGDGGAEAGAAVVMIVALAPLLQVPAIVLGLATSYLLRGPLSEAQTH